MNKLRTSSNSRFLPLCLLAAILFVISTLSNVSVLGAESQNKLERAMFAMGCFWKSQYIFSKLPGVVKTEVGYCGGKTSNPNYKDVCSDKTGHAETVLVQFDPDKTSYKKLLEVFFANHDPTTPNRQGPDLGSQYRSVIFYENERQKDEATAYKESLEREHAFKLPIVTEIIPAGIFYKAESYHQNYYQKNGATCF